MARITKRLVDSLAPTDRERFAWDDALPGFGVRAMPSGVTSYFVQYRNPHGRTRRLKLGRHGALTPDQARRLAAEKLAAVAAGRDPAEEREERRAAVTVAELVARYEAEHLPKKKATSVYEDRRLLAKHLLPVLGRRRVADLTTSDASALHASLKATPVQANRMLFLLSTLCSLAERWGYRPLGSNPCRYVTRYREQARERYLADAELQALGKALDELERAGAGHRLAVAAIRLLALTGARRGEVLSLRWDALDTQRRCAWLADSKTGARALHLEADALALLAELPRTSEWVFPSPRRGQPLREVRKTWRKALELAGISRDTRLHDLRHTNASVAVAAGLSLPLVGGLLGHRRAETTRRYAHLADDPMRAAAVRVQGRIGETMRGKG